MSEKTKREHLVDDVLKTLDALGHYADRSLVTKQTQHHLGQLRSQLRLMVEDYEAEIDQLRDQLAWQDRVHCAAAVLRKKETRDGG